MYDFAEKALKRISPVYENSKFIRQFFKALGGTLDPLRQIVTTLHRQGFIDGVDWGILYEELKYSLEPRPDLTLEERRARLGLKARKHLPLNPAVLEKALLDNLNLKTYLSEAEAGWIRMWLSGCTETTWNSATEFLLTEKPAHLKLAATIHEIDYNGDGSIDDELHTDDDIPIPKTPADKKNYPRLFAGVAEVQWGNVEINIAQPTNHYGRICAGVAEFLSGDIQLDIAKPTNHLVELHAGIGIQIGGTITIGNFDTPNVSNRIRENPTADLLIAGVGIAR